jgi:hypothetical protein
MSSCDFGLATFESSMRVSDADRVVLIHGVFPRAKSSKSGYASGVNGHSPWSDPPIWSKSPSNHQRTGRLTGEAPERP